MFPRILAGLLAGVVGAVPMGLAMQASRMMRPDGSQVSLLAMVGSLVGSQSPAVSWSLHLAIGAVVGGLLGWWYGRWADGPGRGVFFATIHAMFFWMAGAMIAMPMLLGHGALAPIRELGLHPVAYYSLLDHLIYGLATGVAYSLLRRSSTGAAGASARLRAPATT